jgi:class 3 adenylate cyclase
MWADAPDVVGSTAIVPRKWSAELVTGSIGIRKASVLRRTIDDTGTARSTWPGPTVGSPSSRQAPLIQQCPGDRAWNELLTVHNARVRTELSRYHGNEIDAAGDGFFATFDGPERAVRCAKAILEGVQPLGLEVRAGVHTGEVDMTGEKVRGIAVSIGARVAAQAGQSEIFVSQTVKDLVAGSGLAFEGAGDHELKGIPDRWRLYRVVE